MNVCFRSRVCDSCGTAFRAAFCCAGRGLGEVVGVRNYLVAQAQAAACTGGAPLASGSVLHPAKPCLALTHCSYLELVHVVCRSTDYLLRHQSKHSAAYSSGSRIKSERTAEPTRPTTPVQHLGPSLTRDHMSGPRRFSREQHPPQG